MGFCTKKKGVGGKGVVVNYLFRREVKVPVYADVCFILFVICTFNFTNDGSSWI